MGIPGKQRKFSLRRTLDVSKPTGSPDIKSGAITGDERIELPLKVLETLVIPFDQSPIGAIASSHYTTIHLYHKVI